MLYGPMAAGKLTVAKLLSEQLGFRLSHNHLINDLAWSIYDRDTLEGNAFIEELRIKFFQEVARSNVNMITTHAYAHDFISMTGLSDPQYMQQVEKVFEQYDSNIFFVHLKASKETLLERVGDVSRTAYKKLTDKKIMEEYLEQKDFETSPSIKNNITIDNSNLTPEETAKEILNSLDL